MPKLRRINLSYKLRIDELCRVTSDMIINKQLLLIRDPNTLVMKQETPFYKVVSFLLRFT